MKDGTERAVVDYERRKRGEKTPERILALNA